MDLLFLAGLVFITYTGQAGTWIGNSNYGKYLDELETV